MWRGLSLLVLLCVIAGCASPPAPTPIVPPDPTVAPVAADPHLTEPTPRLEPQAVPSCLPYHPPMAQGPGPAFYTMTVQGAEPLIPGAPMRVVGENWPGGAQRVKLLLLSNVMNAMWYGRAPWLIDCLGDQAGLLGEAGISDGHWQWEGALPLTNSDAAALLAVAEDGTFFLYLLPLAEHPGLAKPYSLAIEQVPSDPGTQATIDQPGPVAVWPLLLERPFTLSAQDLAAPDGPVQIHLNYSDETGSDWVDLGTGVIQDGRLTSEPLTIPATLQFMGRQHPAKVPGTYQLIVTNDQRPLSIFLTIWIDLDRPQ